jgi:hypothetical protein
VGGGHVIISRGEGVYAMKANMLDREEIIRGNSTREEFISRTGE